MFASQEAQNEVFVIHESHRPMDLSPGGSSALPLGGNLSSPTHEAHPSWGDASQRHVPRSPWNFVGNECQYDLPRLNGSETLQEASSAVPPQGAICCMLLIFWPSLPLDPHCAHCTEEETEPPSVLANYQSHRVCLASRLIIYVKKKPTVAKKHKEVVLGRYKSSEKRLLKGNSFS